MIKTSNCDNCNIEFEYNPTQKRGKYCSNVCQQVYQSKIIVQKWLNEEIEANIAGRLRNCIRDYILNRDSHACVECGWDKVNKYSGNSALEIDHIDGNHKNNKPENLRSICPNCHSLTSNFKNLNNGNGRESRRNK